MSKSEIEPSGNKETEPKAQVVYQTWVESERGWGTRPDGYSIHLSLDDRDRFIQEYWDSLPDEVPDEYSLPYGDAKPYSVNQKTFMRLQEAKEEQRFGLRFINGAS